MKKIMMELITVMVPVEVVDEDKAMAVKAEVMVKDMAVVTRIQQR
jgi:hypothetical protein